MKQSLFLLTTLTLVTLLSGCASQENTYRLTKNYKPDDVKLYETIRKLDSIFFDAYNTCSLNLEKYSFFYSNDIEFYHDKGGLMNSKQEIVEATKKNICGKVTRELVKGSIEVYPVKEYGAIEIGLHTFHTSEEPNSKPKISRFTIFWKKENNDWKISKVISLH